MVIHTCERCKKQFRKKSNYVRHINNKKPCIKQEIYNCIHCEKEFSRLDSYNRHIKNVCSNNLKCNYCNKVFSSKYSCNRHQSNSCKLRPIAVGNTIINNNTNNTTLNDNRVININLYGFTKEDFNTLPDNFINKILNRGMSSVHNLVKYTTCNTKTPQYHNLLITNKKENYMHVFNGKRWELTDKKDTLEHLAGDRLDFLLEKYYDLKEKDETTLEMDRKVSLLQKAYNNYTDDISLVEKMAKKLEVLLYNSKDIIKKTKKDVESQK